MLATYDINKWPGELSANTNQALIARTYAIAAFGDAENAKLDPAKIDQTKLYDDKGTSYLAVGIGNTQADLDKYSFEALEPSDGTLSALNVNLFNAGTKNLEFDPSDSTNKATTSPKPSILTKVGFIVNELRVFMESDGMVKIPDGTNGIEWDATPHKANNSDSLSILTSAVTNEDTCIVRGTDGWTETTIYIDNGKGDFEGYRSLKIVTNNLDEVVAILYAPTIKVTRGV